MSLRPRRRILSTTTQLPALAAAPAIDPRLLTGATLRDDMQGQERALNDADYAAQRQSLDMDRQQVAADKEAVKQATAAAKQANTASTFAQELQYDAQGIQHRRNPVSKTVEPVPDPMTGRPVMRELTSPVEYDPMGRAMQTVRSKDGVMAREDLDAKAPIGRNPKDKADPNIYVQNSQRPWDAYAPTDALVHSDPRIRTAAAQTMMMEDANALSSEKARIDAEMDDPELKGITPAKREKAQERVAQGLAMEGDDKILEKAKIIDAKQRRLSEIGIEQASRGNMTAEEYAAKKLASLPSDTVNISRQKLLTAQRTGIQALRSKLDEEDAAYAADYDAFLPQTQGFTPDQAPAIRQKMGQMLLRKQIIDAKRKSLDEDVKKHEEFTASLNTQAVAVQNEARQKATIGVPQTDKPAPAAPVVSRTFDELAAAAKDDKTPWKTVMEQERGVLDMLKADPAMPETAKVKDRWQRVMESMDPQNSEEDAYAVNAAAKQAAAEITAANEKDAAAAAERKQAGAEAFRLLNSSDAQDAIAENYTPEERKDLEAKAAEYRRATFQNTDFQEVFDKENKPAHYSKEYGELNVNPSLLFKPDEYTKAVDTAEAPPLAKEKAMQALPLMQQQAAPPIFEGFLSSGPTEQAFQNSIQKTIKDHGWPVSMRGTKDVMVNGKMVNGEMTKDWTDAQKAMAVQEFMSRPDFSPNFNQIALGFSRGLDQLQQTAYGVGSFFGSDAAQKAGEAEIQQQEVQGAAAQAGGGSQILGSLTSGAVSLVPSLGAGILSGGAGLGVNAAMKATSAAAGVQSAGSTMIEAKKAGMGGLAARLTSLGSGFITAGLTQLGGTSGTEAIIGKLFGKGGEQATMSVVRPTLAKAIAEKVKGYGIDGLKEAFLEEMPDQFFQNVLQSATYKPDQDLGEGLVETGIVSFLLGGGVNAATDVLGGAKEKLTIGKEIERARIRRELGQQIAAQNSPEIITATLAGSPMEAQTPDVLAKIADFDARIVDGQDQLAKATSKAQTLYSNRQLAQAYGQRKEYVNEVRSQLRDSFMTAANEEIDAALPPSEDPAAAQTFEADKTRAKALVAIASGKTADLDNATLALVDLTRDEKGNLAPAKGKTDSPDGTPRVIMQDGQPVISQGAIDRMTGLFPATEPLIGKTENERRAEIIASTTAAEAAKQTDTKADVPAEEIAQPPVAEEAAPETKGTTPQTFDVEVEGMADPVEITAATEAEARAAAIAQHPGKMIRSVVAVEAETPTQSTPPAPDDPEKAAGKEADRLALKEMYKLVSDPARSYEIGEFGSRKYVNELRDLKPEEAGNFIAHGSNRGDIGMGGKGVFERALSLSRKGVEKGDWGSLRGDANSGVSDTFTNSPAIVIRDKRDGREAVVVNLVGADAIVSRASKFQNPERPIIRTEDVKAWMAASKAPSPASTTPAGGLTPASINKAIVAASGKRPSKETAKRYQAVSKALHRETTRWQAAFPGGISVATKTGGGGVQVDSGTATPSLRLDFKALSESIDALEGNSLAWVERAIQEEVIHAVAVQMESRGELDMQDLFDSLPEETKAQVRAAYPASNQSLNLGHEFFRMAVQQRLAGRKPRKGQPILTEQTMPPAVLAKLADALNKLLAYFRDLAKSLKRQKASPETIARVVAAADMIEAGVRSLQSNAVVPGKQNSVPGTDSTNGKPNQIAFMEKAISDGQAQIAQLNEQIADWSSRNYKPTQGTDEINDPTSFDGVRTVNFGELNEQKRRRRITEMRREVEQLESKLKSDRRFLQGLKDEGGVGPVSEMPKKSMEQMIAEAKQLAADIAADDALNTPADLKGEKIDKEWTSFAESTRSLGIPREDMPQIKTEHRGALANFLRAGGIEFRRTQILPGSLHPTQAEYSPAKVKKAREWVGESNRAILVSSDDHVLDGHHQWMAALEENPAEPMDVIRLDAPIRELLAAVAQFPSAGMDANPVAAENATTAPTVANNATVAETPENNETPPQVTDLVLLSPSQFRSIWLSDKKAKLAQAEDRGDDGPVVRKMREEIAAVESSTLVIKRTSVTEWISKRGKFAGTKETQRTESYDPASREHARAIEWQGIKQGNPVSAESVVAYGLKLPDNYALQGDVFSPIKADVPETDFVNINTAESNEQNNQTPPDGQQSGGPVVSESRDVPVVPAEPEAQAPAPAAGPDLSPAEQEAKDLMNDLLGGELGTQPVVPAYNIPFPRDKRASFDNVAGKLLDEGVNTPQKLAESLSRIGIPARKFTVAWWRALGSVDTSLPDVSLAEWSGIYSALDKPAAAEETPANGNDLVQRPEGIENGNPPQTGADSNPVGDQSGGSVDGESAGANEGDGSGRDTPAPDGAGGPDSGGRSGGSPAERDGAPEPTGDSTDGRPGDPRGAGLAALDYVITPADKLGQGGLFEKYADNITAIKLVKKLQADGVLPTQAEKAILVKYVGWGGIKGVFNPKNKQWGKQHLELKALLSPEEYAAAKRSMMDAHYTSETVISRGVWAAMKHFGFTGGKMVEGGVGIGHFIGLMPPDIRSATQYTGIEQDVITGAIAGYLYPQSKIWQMGFQDAKLTKGSADGAVGNPPFGQQSIFDPEYKEISRFSIHNYFIAKHLELMRPGAVAGFVVSHNFLDALDSAAREHIAKSATFLGAIRLPNTAFKDNANTEVVTDLVFFRKEEDGGEYPQAWTKSSKLPGKMEGETFSLNDWVASRPEMVLGTPDFTGSMHRENEYTVNPIAGKELADLLDGAVQKLPAGVYDPAPASVMDRLTNPVAADEMGDTKVGGYFIGKDGEIMQRLPDVDMEPQSMPSGIMVEGSKARMRGMIGIRKAMNALVDAEMKDADPKMMDARRKRLNALYDAFVKDHGPLNVMANRRLFYNDPQSARILGLETDFDPGVSKAIAKRDGVPFRKPTAQKSAIFTERTNVPYREITKVSDSVEALATSLNQRGSVNMDYMAELTGFTPQQIAEDLEGLIFELPMGGHEQRELYLAGNVRKKLDVAKAAAALDRRFDKNVEALEKVQPPPIMPEGITAPLGAGWIPPQVYSDFTDSLVGERPTSITYLQSNGGWSINLPDATLAANQTYGVPSTAAMDGEDASPGKPFGEILSAVMNGKPVTVWITVDKKRMVHQTATASAQEKAAAIKDAWERWLFQDEARRDSLTKAYNELVNNYADATFNGSHLTFPGKSPLIELRQHQKDVAWRIITQGSTLLDHVVGAGKTFAGIAAFGEMRRLGRVKKPLFVVPNHLVTQWRDDFIRFYPNANILYARPSDFAKDKRKLLFAKVLTGAYDAIIIGHSNLVKIGMDPAGERELLKEMVDEVIGTIQALMDENDSANGRAISNLERTKESLEAKMARLADRGTEADSVATFEELGIDAMFVDEAHEFKNLFYTTQMQRVAGLGDPSGSAKAFDLYLKTRQLRKRFGPKSPIVFATGTPISNSLVEMFTMQRYLQPDVLEDLNARTLDAWVKLFGNIDIIDEVDPTGTGYRLTTRFKNFHNVGDLSAIYKTTADVITQADLVRQALQANPDKPFPLPEIEGGSPRNYTTNRSKYQEEYYGVETQATDSDGNGRFSTDGEPMMEYPSGTINWRISNMPDDPRIDNMLKLTSDARKAALDMRLVRPDLPDVPESKINMAVKNILAKYKEWEKDRGTQLVFCDLSIPSSAKGKAKAKMEQAKKDVFWFRRAVGAPIEVVPAAYKATPIKFDSHPESDFLILNRKDVGFWSVHERSTGISAGRGSTKSGAIALVTRQLENTSSEKWEKMMSQFAVADEELAAALEGQQGTAPDVVDSSDEQDNAEETNTSVSLDELMAEQSSFSVYDDVRDKLIAGGIPREEIAFIHDFDNQEKKSKLFADVRAGRVRILMGSTPKLGAGTNVQNKLVALHHLDAPWRPSDLEQREGRIIRQGNEFQQRDPAGFEVLLGRYGTNLTYDTRMWQIIENKAAGIEAFKLADRTTRVMDDFAGEAATAADMKAATSGNPLIREEINLRNALDKLMRQQKAWQANQYTLARDIASERRVPGYVENHRKDMQARIDVRDANTTEDFTMKVKNPGEGHTKFSEKKGIAQAFAELIKPLVEKTGKSETGGVASYRGFSISLEYNSRYKELYFDFSAQRVPAWTAVRMTSEDSLSDTGLVQRFDNALNKLENDRDSQDYRIPASEKAIARMEEAMKEPFTKGDELDELRRQHTAVKGQLMSSRKPASNPPPTPLQAQSPAALARSVDAPDGFYSAAVKLLDQKMPARASKEQVKAILASAKPDEVKWSGVMPFIDAQPDTITKEAVTGFMRSEGRVKFEEVALAQDGVADAAADFEKLFQETTRNFGNDEFSWPDEVKTRIQNAEEKVRKANTRNNSAIPPKYSQYQLPGGTNYREVVLAMPDEKQTRLRKFETALDRGEVALASQIDVSSPSANYKSSHFTDVPNYVAHMRLNDRVDGYGAPGLLIEEIQSDRGQMIRKESGTSNEGKTPSMPFEKTWPLQMFKRALRDAVDAGKEWIGWTSGSEQVKRFDLSKQIKSLDATPTDDGTFKIHIQLPNGGERRLGVFSRDELPGVIGKDLAAKIIADSEKEPGRFVRTYEGIDLQVGGEGMRSFYDGILPKEISKYVKQWGGKVERTAMEKPSPIDGRSLAELEAAGEIDNAITGLSKDKINAVAIWRVNITPEMAATVATVGQPLYAQSPRRLLRELGVNSDEIAARAARASQEESGARTVIDPTRAMGAGVNTKGAGNDTILATSDLYAQEVTAETVAQWDDAARAMLAADYEGTFKAITAAARKGGILSPELTRAAQMLTEAESRRPMTKTQMLRMQLLVWSNRLAGTEAARSLRARVDPFKTPAQRHREAIAKSIFMPPPETRAAIESAETPEERSNLILKDSRRIAAIQAALAKMGLTIDDILAGDRMLVARRHDMFRQFVGATLSKEELAASMELIDGAVTFESAASKHGLSAEKLKQTFAQSAAAIEAELRRRVSMAAAAKGKPSPLNAAPIGSDPFVEFDFGGIADLPADQQDAAIKQIMQQMGLFPANQQGKRRTATRRPAPRTPGEAKDTIKIDRGRSVEVSILKGADLSDVTDVYRIMRIHSAAASNGFDMLREYWINNLLSGPVTQFKNATSNLLFGTWNLVASRGLESLVNIVAQNDKSASMGEFTAIMKSLAPAWGRGVRLAKLAWETESDHFAHMVLDEHLSLMDTGPAGEYRQTAIPGKVGRVVRMPGRALMFADGFFKGLFGTMEAAAHAHRIAKAEGLAPGSKQFQTRMDALVAEPGSEAWIAAVRQAETNTFQNQLDPAKNPLDAVPKTIISLSHSKYMMVRLVATLLFPFTKTPYNVYREGLRRSPLGAVLLAGQAAKAGWVKLQGGQLRTDVPPALIKAFAEQVFAWTGTLLLLSAIEGDDDDYDKKFLITGSAPKDRGGRDMQERTSGGAYVIKWGRTVIPYGGIEPIATVLGTVADMVRTAKTDGTLAEKTNAIFHAVKRGAIDKTFLQGLKGISDLLANDETSGGPSMPEKARRAVLQAIVPNIIRQPLRNSDSNVPDSAGAPWYYDAIPLPGSTEARVNAGSGEEKQRTGTAMSRILIPSAIQPEENVSPIDKALMAWNRSHPDDAYSPEGVSKSMEMNKQRIDLSPKAINYLNKRSGTLARKMLANTKLSGDERSVKLIKKAYEDARSRAREELKRWPLPQIGTVRK